MLGLVAVSDVLALAREIEADPDLRRVLEEAVHWHDAHPGDIAWEGFAAPEVHAAHWRMRRLNERGIVDQAYRSNKAALWRLADPAAVRDALELASVRPAVREDVQEPTGPADLFDIVEGADVVKGVLWDAIRAERPVHVLLEGPPASAKSTLLTELERLPASLLCSGATTTRAGIIGYLLDHPNVRWLLVDELDKADGRDMLALYDLMAEGRVRVLRHGRHADEKRQVSVFGTCNDAGRLTGALLSRFTRLGLKPYDEDEFRTVALAVLVRREGADPELASAVAHAVAPHTRDPRRAVDIYRLCHGDLRRVAELVRAVLASA